MTARDFLSSEEQRLLYDCLLGVLMARAPSVPIPADPEQINRILKAVLTDHPELFWFEGKWTLRREYGQTLVCPIYCLDEPTIRSGQQEIAACAEGLACLNGRLPLEKARAVYDWMLTHTDYGVGTGQGQTMYDALVGRMALCKGLAKAYQFLLGRLGVFATLQEGTLDGRTRHIWNIIGLDGHYAHVDVSMGFDRFAFLFTGEQRNDRYRCFALSDRQLFRTHRLTGPEWPRLICDLEFGGTDLGPEEMR